MPEPKTQFVLPESFLEAARAAAHNPLYFASKRGGLVRVPFIGGGAEGGEGEGTEGGSGTEGGDAGGTAGGEGAGNNDGGENGGEGGGDDDDEDGDEDETSGMPDHVKAILKKNRRLTRDAQRAAELANQKAADAEAKAKSYEDRDKSDLEKATERAEAAEKRATELEERNSRLARRTAFLSVTDYAWHDPDDALKLALDDFGLADLEVNADGGVDRKKLKKLVKDLADGKPYLVKTEGDRSGGKGGASGASFNGGKGGPKGKDEAAMARRFSAMAGRRKAQ